MPLESLTSKLKKVFENRKLLIWERQLSCLSSSFGSVQKGSETEPVTMESAVFSLLSGTGFRVAVKGCLTHRDGC